MIKRIELIIQSQNLTPSQFADRIGIQRSGLSHILSGRNNPSLDFVQKVLVAFPELDPGWLLQGRGRMYVNLSESISRNTEPVPDLFSMENFLPTLGPEEKNPVREEEKTVFEEAETKSPLLPERADGPERKTLEEKASLPSPDLSDRKVAVGYTEKHRNGRLERILFFYEDGTFEEYRPR